MNIWEDCNWRKHLHLKSDLHPGECLNYFCFKKLSRSSNYFLIACFVTKPCPFEKACASLWFGPWFSLKEELYNLFHGHQSLNGIFYLRLYWIFCTVFNKSAILHGKPYFTKPVNHPSNFLSSAKIRIVFRSHSSRFLRHTLLWRQSGSVPLSSPSFLLAVVISVFW